jgi:hypothetical protein
MDASATRTVFYVVHHEGRWRFEVNDEDHGPFCTQTAAIRAAVDAAHSAGEKGGAAQVLVQRAKRAASATLAGRQSRAVPVCAQGT